MRYLILLVFLAICAPSPVLAQNAYENLMRQMKQNTYNNNRYRATFDVDTDLETIRSPSTLRRQQEDDSRLRERMRSTYQAPEKEDYGIEVKPVPKQIQEGRGPLRNCWDYGWTMVCD